MRLIFSLYMSEVTEVTRQSKFSYIAGMEYTSRSHLGNH